MRGPAPKVSKIQPGEDADHRAGLPAKTETATAATIDRRDDARRSGRRGGCLRTPDGSPAGTTNGELWWSPPAGKPPPQLLRAARSPTRRGTPSTTPRSSDADERHVTENVMPLTKYSVIARARRTIRCSYSEAEVSGTSTLGRRSSLTSADVRSLRAAEPTSEHTPGDH